MWGIIKAHEMLEELKAGNHLKKLEAEGRCRRESNQYGN
jgi:hypothetical protein